MTLTIKANRTYSRLFLKFLYRILRNKILNNIDFMKLLYYSDKLSEAFGDKVDCHKAIRQVVKSFEMLSEPTHIYIRISPRIKLAGTNLSLAAVILAMEYGALDLKPYPLIRKSVKNVEDNLDMYYNRYLGFRR